MEKNSISFTPGSWLNDTMTVKCLDIAPNQVIFSEYYCSDEDDEAGDN